MFVGFIRMPPPALDEAAAIDGAGAQYTLWRIIFPLMRPIVATVFILNALSVWNDFAGPQVILGPAATSTRSRPASTRRSAPARPTTRRCFPPSCWRSSHPRPLRRAATPRHERPGRGSVKG
ncbi:ABC transporter permease subunit [Streptomyces violaceus]|uniref:ABC transporter permease subunit n=1 Tax=Streptomyces violaceus TaxID=1936 RepID=UPI0031E9047A